ncbi:DUF2764 family protein [Aliagarivorans marinus]|uniref:DUF2764 family protein n=1 Tax=Aliagarivorans marinus TaxID=561965 RepID=UPI0004261B05|nr:DUF2764 family protein [Aliagarivorans marinus]
MANNAYHSLLASLPHLDSLFDCKQLPISRFQLDQRLSALGFSERALLNEIEQQMEWGNEAPARPEQNSTAQEFDLIQHAHSLINRVNSPDLAALLNWRLDVRTVVAALRKRMRGEKAPGYSRWSFGSRREFIRRNWNAPYFNLEHRFLWLPDVAKALEQGHSFEAEKLLLAAVWQHLSAEAAKQRFSFEAVVIYVLRWNVLQRWTSYNHEQAIVRFDQLVEQALGQYAAALPE